MTLPLKTIIVDDEWLVRSELRMMLSDHSGLQVTGEAANVAQALELIKKEPPEVIFLDIQMPGASGFELLERAEIKAKIVFITAYDQYAIRAFEVNALDYLLKPIQKERLAKTIRRLETGTPATPVKTLDYSDVVYVLIDGSLKFVKVSGLKCIRAEGNYTYIHCQNRKRELVAKSLQEWEEMLPQKYFVRIHRSTIVNFEYVEKVDKCENYTHLVYLREVDKPVVMSRRYAAKLKNLLIR